MEIPPADTAVLWPQINRLTIDLRVVLTVYSAAMATAQFSLDMFQTLENLRCPTAELNLHFETPHEKTTTYSQLINWKYSKELEKKIFCRSTSVSHPPSKFLKCLCRKEKQSWLTFWPLRFLHRGGDVGPKHITSETNLNLVHRNGGGRELQSFCSHYLNDSKVQRELKRFSRVAAVWVWVLQGLKRLKTVQGCTGNCLQLVILEHPVHKSGNVNTPHGTKKTNI